LHDASRTMSGKPFRLVDVLEDIARKQISMANNDAERTSGLVFVVQRIRSMLRCAVGTVGRRPRHELHDDQERHSR